MSDFDEYDDDIRARRRAQPNAPRANSRPPRDPSASRRPDDEEEDWRTDDDPSRRPISRSAQDLHDDTERWPDEEEQDDEDWRPNDAPRRLERGDERRDSLMRRRLRVARGEEADIDDDGDIGDFEDRRPPRRYARSEPSYAPRYQSGGCGVRAALFGAGWYCGLCAGVAGRSPAARQLHHQRARADLARSWRRRQPRCSTAAARSSRSRT